MRFQMWKVGAGVYENCGCTDSTSETGQTTRQCRLWGVRQLSFQTKGNVAKGQALQTRDIEVVSVQIRGRPDLVRSAVTFQVRGIH